MRFMECGLISSTAFRWSSAIIPFPPRVAGKLKAGYSFIVQQHVVVSYKECTAAVAVYYYLELLCAEVDIKIQTLHKT